MGIPFKSYSESKRTLFGIVGKSYFTVMPQMTLLHPEFNNHLDVHLPHQIAAGIKQDFSRFRDTCSEVKGKNHIELARIESRADPLYGEIVEFIKRCLA